MPTAVKQRRWAGKVRLAPVETAAIAAPAPRSQPVSEPSPEDTAAEGREGRDTLVVLMFLVALPAFGAVALALWAFVLFLL
jgi:hypothetical protein